MRDTKRPDLAGEIETSDATPRRRGRPRVEDTAALRARNLRWLLMSTYNGLSVIAIAAAESPEVSPRTVRRGIQSARSYPQTRRRSVRESDEWQDS